jgi:GDP-D-mannose dehydratase
MNILKQLFGFVNALNRNGTKDINININISILIVQSSNTPYLSSSKARMLLTSTSEVYGDPEVHPQKETYWGNVNPIGKYGCTDSVNHS